RCGRRAARLEAGGLGRAVRAFRAALERRASQDWEAHAAALHARLWQPLEGLVHTKSVIVVAHGALHYLPFAALRNPGGSFLNERHDLRFLPSASALKILRPQLEKMSHAHIATVNWSLHDSCVYLDSRVLDSPPLK